MPTVSDNIGLPDEDVYSELQANYVDESHIEAFAHALNAEYFVDNDYLDSPRASPSTASLSSTHLNRPHLLRQSSNVNGGRSPRIRKVSALSDFAPVNLRVKKRKKGTKQLEKRQEWLFVLVRWPLLILIFLFIFFEFGMYVSVRQCVNAKEWFTAWRGQKGKLRMKLRAARTYEEWKEAARALDEYLGFDEWKAIDEDSFYDWRLVRKVLRSLRTLRRNDDARGVLGVLETCIRTNFAGVESARLYSETFYGTKDLIEMYISEVEKAMIYIRDSTMLSSEEKRRFFKSANMNLGISALCLSGGASFGYYHFGVLKAFVDADSLPRVLSATSAGGIVAALACTRTDAELKRLLVPELADMITACEEPNSQWIKRFWKTGARFDSVDWARKACFFTRGSLTFREAYQRTNRILNVSVIPADRHSPTKLLNYMTAPDTVIWSAIIASAAVPGILNPVVLMQKTKEGNLVPWNWGSKFKDGSLRVDIPLQSLNHYFNVTHPIVSQVNPHVHLFFFAPRGSAGKPVAHRKGKGWRGNFLLSAAEQWLKLELTKNFKVIRDLDLLAQLLGQDWSSVFLQRFDGTVTIWPRTRFMVCSKRAIVFPPQFYGYVYQDWIHILSDPDRLELERMIKGGEAVTWPKLHMIENRFRLEREILRGRRAVRRKVSVRERIPPSDVDPGNIPDISMGAPQSPDIEQPDAAWPMDTDTDMPFKYDVRDGKLRLWAAPRGQQTSGTSTPVNLKDSQDPLRSPARRRRWTSQLLREGEGSVAIEKQDYGLGPPDPPPSGSASSSASDQQGFLNFAHIQSGGLLRSLRARPFPRFSFKRQDKAADAVAEEAVDMTWSSDSSELDEELEMYDDGEDVHGPVMSSSQELHPEDVS
ncbi:patatin-domain-containing protein [Phellopilus nigrolimitatus]|nr:patatin-domain-containing protein [Phellopilus nigrolimitatus]